MEPIIQVNDVSMRFNLAKEKSESLKEYFLQIAHGKLKFDEFYALKTSASPCSRAISTASSA